MPHSIRVVPQSLASENFIGAVAVPWKEENRQYGFQDICEECEHCDAVDKAITCDAGIP